MRPALASLCLLAMFILADSWQPGNADDTDWADCLSCHTEIDSGLPALSAIRPRLNDNKPSQACESCHTDGVPDFFAGDWTHPVRSVGEHIGCDNCHPPLPHSAEFPPPVPTGDYRVDNCLECHGGLERHMDQLGSHLGSGLVRCIDCHDPHDPLRAFLPDSLLSPSMLERRGSYYQSHNSNDSCTVCHSSFDLYDDRVSNFITLNTENYHRLHVEGQRIGCVECHDPHGSSQQALIRRTLITGELMTYLPTGRGASCSVTCHGATHDSLEYVNRLP